MINNVGLAKEFYQGLVRYHNVDGKGNGGRVEGLQLPPGVDAAHLDGFLHGLSDSLSRQSGIDYIPSPTEPAARGAFRKALAESRRADVSSHVQQNISAAVGLIQDPALAASVRTALKAAPAEFFTAPSSSTGKYHPADEINPGGLAFHSLRDVKMGDILCDYFKVGGAEKDQILSALLLHDIEKGGVPWHGYAKDHGPIGERFLDGVWDHTKDPALDHIEELVSNHMAQWNFPDPTPPKDLDNQIVSYADYLASLDNVYMQIPVG